MQSVTLPSMPVLNQSGAMDHFLFGSLRELAESALCAPNREASSFNGDVSSHDAARRCIHGDLSCVAASDKLLSALGDIVPVSTGWQITDSVVGAFPNVPNYISGNPVAMRTRSRTVRAQSPLTVIVDQTSSAIIDASHLTRRGAAILALVRALSAMRPIELFVGTGYDGKLAGESATGASYIFAKVESLPLDLARASFALGHPSFSRGLCMALAFKNHGYKGSWPYKSERLFRQHGPAILARVIPPSHDVLFVPAVVRADDSIPDGPAWLRAKLKEYGGETINGEG